MAFRMIKNKIGLGLLSLCMLFSAAFLILFIGRIAVMGSSVISWEFLSSPPRNSMTQGGIFPALLGSFWLTVLSIGIALPLGVLTAIFLFSYGKPVWLVRLVKLAIDTLAGMPSIIYGLFGMAIFVGAMKLNVSMLAGSLTLAVLALPIIINAAEEALRSVPNDFQEASLALGASQRQTIQRVLLPSALPGILTGSIISIGRVAGETAPIMFTAATFYSRLLPRSPMDEVMALPYHIYALMTEGSHAKAQVPIAYGTALVLIMMVLGISGMAIYIRYRIRRTRKW